MFMVAAVALMCLDRVRALVLHISGEIKPPEGRRFAYPLILSHQLLSRSAEEP
jgi:uncharacterized Tic20 family protein